MTRMIWKFLPATMLMELAADWDETTGEDSNLPILDAFFCCKALQHFGVGNEILAVGRSNNELVAAGIFRKERLSFNLFQPSQAPLGPWVTRKGIPWDQTIPSIKGALGTRYPVVGISQQDPFYHEMPTGIPNVECIDYIETASLETTTSFENYWISRGKNLRQNMRKQRNRLSRDGVNLKLVKLSNAREMSAGVDAFAELEATGWKSAKGTAVKPTAAQGDFYTEILQYFAAHNEACIYEYFFGDQQVASDLCLHRNGIILVLKTAFDSNISRYSPAFLMREEIMCECHTDPTIRRIEFYGRVMDWHTKWTEEIRTLYHINWVSSPAKLARKFTQNVRSLRTILSK